MDFKYLLIGQKFKWDLSTDVVYTKVGDYEAYNHETEEEEVLTEWDINQLVNIDYDCWTFL